MTLNAKCWIRLCVVDAIFWNASSILQHQTDLTLGALAAIVCDAASNLCYTLVVWVQLISWSARNTDTLRIVLQASWSAEALNIVKARATLWTYNSVERTTIVNHTQTINIQFVSSGTCKTFPCRCVEVRTLIWHTVIVQQLILRIALLTFSIYVVKWNAVVHVA